MIHAIQINQSDKTQSNQLRRFFALLSLFSLLFLLLFSSNFAQAENCPSCGASNASDALSLGASKVIEGSIDVSAATGSLVIESVASVTNGLIIVVKGASVAASEATSASANATIQLSGKGIQQLGLASGAVLQVSAVVTGHLLISAGKAIAFIPNEIGKELLYQAKLK